MTLRGVFSRLITSGLRQFVGYRHVVDELRRIQRTLLYVVMLLKRRELAYPQAA